MTLLSRVFIHQRLSHPSWVPVEIPFRTLLKHYVIAGVSWWEQNRDGKSNNKRETATCTDQEPGFYVWRREFES